MSVGCLYVVSTPIGNLEDITSRAVRILKEVDLIAAEDTRHTRRLTAHYGIKTHLRSYYQYNRLRQADKLLRLLDEGREIALVSNAGTPGISDPGSHLVKLALERGIRVVPVPGPTALIAALSVSGLSGTNFIFYGWLSPKGGRRKRELESLEGETRTIIFYEAPHRLLRMMRDIREVLGDRHVVIGRELTKKFEEVLRGRVSELIATFEERKPRGEFTLILSGKR
jgi:16S rRNA (cytidine1402-2'-O)-methyltransferase